MTEIRNPSMDLFRPYVPDIAGFIEKGHKPGQSCLCTSKISHKGKSTLVDQFEYLKTLTPKEKWGEIKLTMIAPPWYHLRYKDGKAYPKDVYKDDEEYFADIAKAVSTELDILYEAGVRNVQFDDPNFACNILLFLPLFLQSEGLYGELIRNQISAPRKCFQAGSKTKPTPKPPNKPSTPT